MCNSVTAEFDNKIFIPSNIHAKLVGQFPLKKIIMPFYFRERDTDRQTETERRRKRLRKSER